MSFGTRINAKIYISRTTFESKKELEDYIKSQNNYLLFLKDRLFLLSSLNPSLIPDDYAGDRSAYFHDEITYTIDGIIEISKKIQLYEIWLDNFDSSEIDGY